MADGIAVIARNLLRRRALRTPISVNDSPVAIPASEQHQDSAEFFLFHELEAVRHLKLTWAAGGNASGQRIIFKEGSLPVLEQRLCPRLEWRDLTGIRQVDEKPVVGHGNLWGGVFDDRLCAGCSPVALLACRWSQSNLSIGPSWSRRSGRCSSSRCGVREQFLAGLRQDNGFRRCLPDFAASRS